METMVAEGVLILAFSSYITNVYVIRLPVFLLRFDKTHIHTRLKWLIDRMIDLSFFTRHFMSILATSNRAFIREPLLPRYSNLLQLSINTDRIH